jgi:hypothetical protein
MGLCPLSFLHRACFELNTFLAEQLVGIVTKKEGHGGTKNHKEKAVT